MAKKVNKDLVIFQAKSGAIELRGDLSKETIWASQKQIGDIFQVNVRTVNEHLTNIFKSKELDENSVIRNFRITASDGKTYLTENYDLDAVIPVGYRVNSKQVDKRKIRKSSGLIIEGSRLLIERSREDKKFKIPGGKVDAGETFEQALIREIKEEVDVEITNEDFKFYKEIHFETSKYEVQMKIFFINSYKGTLKPSSEVSELAWATKDKFKEYLLGRPIENEVISDLIVKELL